MLSGDPHVTDFYGTKFDLHTPGVYQVVKTQEVDVQTTVKHCGGRNLQRLGGRIVGCNSLLQIKLNGGDHVVSMAVDSAYRNSQGYVDGVAKTRHETIRLGSTTVSVRGKNALVVHTPEFEFHMTGKIWNGRGKGSAYLDITVRAKRLIGSVPGVCRGNGVVCSGFTGRSEEEQEELQLGSANTSDEQEEQDEQDELQVESSRRRRRRSRRRRARRAQRNFAECTNYRLGAAQAIPFKTAAAAAPPVALPGFGNLISKNKPASQVSEGWSGRPSRAVDGNSNGSYGSGSCTHTGVATRAWWKVDLRATYAVDKVVVWNRVDCCASRLNNFEVLVDSQLCGKVGHAHRSNTVSCHKKKGRSVTVRLAGRNYLTLCEVQVYGGTCSEEQEQLQLGSGVSATERCEVRLEMKACI